MKTHHSQQNETARTNNPLSSNEGSCYALKSKSNKRDGSSADIKLIEEKQ